MGNMLKTLGVGTPKKDSAVKSYFKERAGKKGRKTGGEVDMKELLEKKLEEVKSELKGSGYYKIALPGTDPNQQREVSKAAEAAMERIAQIRAKKTKKTKDAVAISPRNFGGAVGGHMNSRGVITDSQGNIVLKVDKNTGKIRNANGAVVGKYNPASNYNAFQIEKLIAKYSIINRGNMLANTFALPPGWGGAPDSGGGGDAWAPEKYEHDYGGFWGNKD